MIKRLILVSLLILILLVGCESIYINKISDEDLAQNINCQEKAKELIPQYLFLEGARLSTNNQFKDGINFDIPWKKNVFGVCAPEFSPSFRSGSEKGENVNYLYFTPPGGACEGQIVYSKDIISDEGVVLGTREFKFAPTLKKYETSIKYEQGFSGSTFVFRWSGFDDNIKEIFNIDGIRFWVYDSRFGGELCNETISDEVGIFTCDGVSFGNVGDVRSYLHIEPDIFHQEIYEIIEYNFAACNWVE